MASLKKAWALCAGVFYTDGRPDRLLIAIFIVAQLISLTNAVIHNPRYGYDTYYYWDYIEVFPERFPTQEDSKEFFSAPLPFILPAYLNAACKAVSTVDAHKQCAFFSGKVAQGVNVLFGALIFILMLKIAERIFPGNHIFKISLMAFFAILPVHYKTFAQVRGEPYVALFSMLALFLMLRLWQCRETIDWRDGAVFGLVIGALVFSRQWGFFTIPAVFALQLFIIGADRPHALRMLRVLVIAGLVAFVVSSWWYFHLLFDFGTFLAFNREGVGGFALSNQPLSFYLGFGNGKLFTAPTDGAFNNQVWPTLYADLWGDYWGFFTYILERSYLGEIGLSNAATINPYLGRVNLVSLPATALLLAGLVPGAAQALQAVRAPRQADLARIFYLLITVLGITVFIGYFWFLISYPAHVFGNTIKATYILQFIHLLPFFAALLITRLTTRWPRVFPATLILLGLIFLHNLPAMVTRHPPISLLTLFP